jgi:hypothetical protein
MPFGFAAPQVVGFPLASLAVTAELPLLRLSPFWAFGYVELFDFQIQRRARNSEFGGGSAQTGNFSVTFREGRFDEFFLVALEVRGERT